MGGFLDKFREKVTASVWKNKPEELKQPNIDDKIALGVLLWVVAEADNKFLPEETEKIKSVLKDYAKLSDEDMPVVMGSIEQAAAQRIDLHRFTREVSKDLSYEVKLSILENLFRIACIDKDLDHEEHEVIRQIAGLFNLEHKDFIDAKIKIKKEFGLNTAGL